MKRTLMGIVTGIACWLTTAPARADYVIELVPSGTTRVSQGQNTSFTVSAINTGSTAIDLGQLNLGIQLLADGSPTGSIVVDSFAPAVTNSPWFSPSVSAPVLSTLVNGDINGTTDYYLMSITESDLSNVGDIPVGESRNLGMITFTTSNDALGTWQLFVVNENLESGPLTAITTPLFESVEFVNLAAPAFPAAGVSLPVVTFMVVPEPGCGALATIGGLGLALAAFRGRIGRRWTAV